MFKGILLLACLALAYAGIVLANDGGLVNLNTGPIGVANGEANLIRKVRSALMDSQSCPLSEPQQSQ